MKKYVYILMSMLIFSGCSVVNVSTDYNPNINFASYKTYAIIDYKQGDALVNNRVEDAIKNEMNLKSYKLVDEKDAEFIILYRYTSKDKSQTRSEFVSTGMGRYGRYGGFYTTSTYHYTEGNFEIRMANPKTKDTFWRADGVNTLQTLDTPQERTTFTNEVVNKMLQKYPVSK